MPGQLSLLGLWQRQMKGADHQSAVNTTNERINSTLFLASVSLRVEQLNSKVFDGQLHFHMRISSKISKPIISVFSKLCFLFFPNVMRLKSFWTLSIYSSIHPSIDFCWTKILSSWTSSKSDLRKANCVPVLAMWIFGFTSYLNVCAYASILLLIHNHDCVFLICCC